MFPQFAQIPNIRQFACVAVTAERLLQNTPQEKAQALTVL